VCVWLCPDALASASNLQEEEEEEERHSIILYDQQSGVLQDRSQCCMSACMLRTFIESRVGWSVRGDM